jgi:hypothetical protein
MKFGRNQPRSQPIVRVARLAGPELVLLPSSRHTYQTADGPVIAVPMREKRRRAVKPKDANFHKISPAYHRASASLRRR